MEFNSLFKFFSSTIAILILIFTIIISLNISNIRALGTYEIFIENDSSGKSNGKMQISYSGIQYNGLKLGWENIITIKAKVKCNLTFSKFVFKKFNDSWRHTDSNIIKDFDREILILDGRFAIFMDSMVNDNTIILDFDVLNRNGLLAVISLPEKLKFKLVSK